MAGQHGERRRILVRCHPNYLMNVAHGYIVAANPSTRGTDWEVSSDRCVAAWEAKVARIASDDDLVFYEEADAAVLSYARAITSAYKRWEAEVALAYEQHGRTERQMTHSVLAKSLIGVVRWSAKTAIVAGLGGAIGAMVGSFVPQRITDAAGLDLFKTIGALAFAAASIAVGSIWGNRLWSAAAAELRWCLGAAEAALERSSIEAFDLHWFQLCEAYRAYTGLDYRAEPSFISIMRNKLRARERWDRKVTFRLTANTRLAIELARRVIKRARTSAEGAAK